MYNYKIGSAIKKQSGNPLRWAAFNGTVFIAFNYRTCIVLNNNMYATIPYFFKIVMFKSSLSENLGEPMGSVGSHIITPLNFGTFKKCPRTRK